MRTDRTGDDRFRDTCKSCTHTYRSALYAACSAAVLSIATTGAFAQAASDVEAVVVTGSRVVTNGANTPTPVTVISADQLLAANPGAIANALNYQPQFLGSAKSENSANSAANAENGTNVLNLRRLGLQRTLVLLDGRRLTPTTQIGATDINTLPSGLIQRVDVVTGGASAAYGSDAVSGVVNFILDTKFTGFKGEIDAGASAGFGGTANMPSTKLSLTWGDDFAGGHGHIVANFDYYYKGRPPTDQYKNMPWVSADNFVINAAGVRPTRFRAPNVTTALGTYGGLISAGPLRGIQFGPGGTQLQHDYGVSPNQQIQSGGNGNDNNPGIGSGIMPVLSGFTHAEYAFDNGWKVFAEVMGSRTKTSGEEYYPWHLGANAMTIQRDNAFLPDNIRAQMVANNLSTITLGRMESESPMFIQTSSNSVESTLGFQGELSGTKLEGGFTLGASQLKVLNPNDTNEPRYFAAVDAVKNAAGTIVCRATLTGNFPGCVPYNPFGQGSPSAEARKYVFGTAYFDLHYTRAHAYLTASREDLFKLWSSDGVGAALGFEYRLDNVNQNTDSVSPSFMAFPGVLGAPSTYIGKQGAWQLYNPQPFHGEYTIAEGFGELNVPVLSDVNLVKDFSLNLAARITGYSTSGNAFTWKVGANYALNDSIRFRATQSRDIRAPTLVDLFSPGSFRAGAPFQNPLTGTTIFAQGPANAGNPNLKPEAANTFTGGFVLTPDILQGFYASADYYDIDVHNSIGIFDPQTFINRCFVNNEAQSCGLITSFSGTQLNYVQRLLNLGAQERRGIDFEIGYTTDVGEGELTTRLLGSYLIQDVTRTTGAPDLITSGFYNNPMWNAVANATYSVGNWSFFGQFRLMDGGKYGQGTFLNWTPGVDIDQNHVSTIGYADATVTYKLKVWGADSSLFASVNNVFDKTGPWSPTQDGGLNFRSSDWRVYDFVGRYITVGLRFKN